MELAPFRYLVCRARLCATTVRLRVMLWHNILDIWQEVRRENKQNEMMLLSPTKQIATTTTTLATTTGQEKSRGIFRPGFQCSIYVWHINAGAHLAMSEEKTIIRSAHGISTSTTHPTTSPPTQNSPIFHTHALWKTKKRNEKENQRKAREHHELDNPFSRTKRT